MSAPGVGTRTTNNDVVRLERSLKVFFRIDDADYADDPVHLALEDVGVTKFEDEFLLMTDAQFDGLDYLDTALGARVQLPLGSRNKLRCLKAFYHMACYVANKPIEISSLDVAMFDQYRTMVYDPEAPIKPWKKTTTDTSESDAMDRWQRTVKPSKSDYKEFRDETTWIRAKEKFITTLESHNLEHLVNEHHVVTNGPLDTAQKKWLFKVLQDIMQAPIAKSIVTKHKTTKDTRAIWKDICEHYDKSMSQSLRAQQLSTYLTSTRLHNINWNGKQTNFLMHWKQVAHDHNEISQEPFTPAQLITFLNATLSGTPGLDTILQTNNSARKAAGNTTPLSFEEYIQLLLNQAAVHDAANVRSTNPRSRRGVNVHELEFDDQGYPEDADPPSPYEVEVHDMDTPIEDIMVMQNEQLRRNNNTNNSSRGTSQPRKVRVDFSTWNKLTTKDQTKWDEVSESGKGILLAYAAKNPDKYLQAAELPNVHKAAMIRISDKAKGNRSINNHELLFEDDAPQDNLKIDVKTHEQDLISFEEPIPSKNKTAPNLLEMATKKSSKQDWSISNVDINHVLSASKTAPRQVTLHEQCVPQSEYTPYEVNVHRINFMGGMMEVPSDNEEEEEEETH